MLSHDPVTTSPPASYDYENTFPAGVTEFPLHHGASSDYPRIGNNPWQFPPSSSVDISPKRSQTTSHTERSCVQCLNIIRTIPLTRGRPVSHPERGTRVPVFCRKVMEQSQRNLAAGLTRTRAGLIGSLVGGLILAGGSALAEHQGEEVDFRVHRSPFSIDVMGRWGQPLFTLTDGVEVSTVNGSKPREQSFLLRWSQGETVRRVVVDQVLAVSEAGPSTTIILGEAGSTEPRARLILSRPAEGVLRILAVAIDPTTNRMRILLTARPEERFYGMGSRFDNSEHKNSTVTQWAREVATNLPGICQIRPSRGS